MRRTTFAVALSWAMGCAPDAPELAPATHATPRATSTSKTFGALAQQGFEKACCRLSAKWRDCIHQFAYDVLPPPEKSKYTCNQSWIKDTGSTANKHMDRLVAGLATTEPLAWALNLGTNDDWYARPYLESTLDEQRADAVDMLYLVTHGGAGPNNAVYALWQFGENAFTAQMRLGDEAKELSLLATYACRTLRVKDGGVWNRWSSVVKGGLAYVMGSHDIVYIGKDKVGKYVAENMHDDLPFIYAWPDAVHDSYSDNDAAVLAAAPSKGHCNSRRVRTKWSNFTGWPRFRDQDVDWMCWSYWGEDESE